ncbi:MAG: hypothetical protein HOE17_05370 [Rhodobiaceae bacterium]|nr:hypothetical protein [Rhodobiaceae bacterium]
MLPSSINDEIEGYSKNEGTRQEVISDEKYYTYSYKFKDHNNKTRIWTWNAPRKESDKMINDFGIPEEILKKTSISRLDRNKIYHDGYFHIDKNTGYLSINYNLLINDSRSLVAGIADIVISIAKEEKLNMRDVVDLILAFCQDIPYGIPQRILNGKFTNGFAPPPLSLKNKWSDCDSKAVLFASIYHAITSESIVLINTPGHLFVGISTTPGPYDNTISFRGKKYIIAEQTGTKKVYLGHTSLTYKKPKMIFPVVLEDKYVRPRLPIFSESKVLGGNSVNIILKENNKKILGKYNIYCRYNTVGSFYKQIGKLKPQSNHSLVFSTTKFSKFVEIMVNHNVDGYYFPETKIDMSNEDDYVVDFSDDKCIFVKSKDNQSFYLHTFDLERNKSKFKRMLKTDENGLCRVILPNGYYYVTKNPTFRFINKDDNTSSEDIIVTKGFKYYDSKSGKGIKFDI